MSPFSQRLRVIVRPFLALALALPALKAWSSPDELMVVGNQFVSTSTGCTIVLRGVNVDSLEYNSSGTDGGVCNDIVASTGAAITRWHANLIRVPLSQDFWFGVGNSKTTNPNQAAYRALVDTLVGTCRNNNAYCLLDLHWSGNGNWGTAVQQENMPDIHSTPFWADVAARYANNPAVLFDLYNEPKGITDWNIWRNGDATGAAVGFVSPGMQPLLNTIRGAGANNIVVAGGLDWAYDLSGVPANHLTDVANGRGVAYATHIYPWKGSAPWVPTNGDAKIRPAGDLYPVIVGEFGQDADNHTSCGNCADAGYPGYSTGAWTTSVVQWMNLRGYSGTAWDFQRNSGPILLSDCAPNYDATTWNGAPVSQWLVTATPVIGCQANFTPILTMTPTPTNTPTVTATGTLPTLTFTITNTPTNTLTITPTPVSTICVSVPWPCESRSENGSWIGNNAGITQVDSSTAPPGAITQGSHCLKVDITTGVGWNNQVFNLVGSFSPNVWADQYELLVDVYADPTFITNSGSWHQLFLRADIGTQSATTFTSPTFYSLNGGANDNLVFRLDYSGVTNPTAAMTALYFIYNSQNGAVGNGALYFDNIRLVRGCSFTNTPTPTNTGTPTFTPTATFTPTPTPTGTWFTDTPTPTVTFTPSPTGTPGPGTIETPIAYPNPFPYPTPGVPGGDVLKVQLNLGNGEPQDVTLKFFTLSFRKVLEHEYPAQVSGPVTITDTALGTLGNGLYYLVLEDSKKNRAIGKMLIQR